MGSNTGQTDNSDVQKYGQDGYVIEWPYPQAGNQPSHYPPYYKSTP